MKTFKLLTLAVALLLSGCAAFENTFALPPTSRPNFEQIDSLIDILQLDKAKSSVAGFTCESTFGDVMNRESEEKVSTVFLTYYAELLGSPAIVKYIFRNINDGNEDIAVGNPTLALIIFDIFQDKDRKCDEQIKELVYSLDTVLGSHSYDEESEIYNWEDESCRFSLDTDTSLLMSGTIAQVSAFSLPGVDLTGLVPYAFGTDIETIYRNETPAPLPEYYASEPYSYYLSYGDGFSFFFSIRDSELKLSSLGFQTDLYDMEIEDIGNCLESFGDRMEEILGPADSRSSMPYETKPSLFMEWPGVEVKAYNYIGDETYSIFVNVSEGYFVGNESAEK